MLKTGKKYYLVPNSCVCNISVERLPCMPAHNVKYKLYLLVVWNETGERGEAVVIVVWKSDTDLDK
jgi:hypothetical protein